MDDEGAAIDKLIQRFEDPAKSRGLLDIRDGEPVEVVRAGVDIRLEHGVEALANIAGIIKGHRIDGDDAAGRGVDARGLQREGHVGVLGDGLGFFRLLLRRAVRAGCGG